MGSVFRLEGGLMGALTKISDICIISLLWLFCCLPVVTIGASTTAAYYTVIKVVRRQSGNLTQSFFHSFRENLKDSLAVNLSYLALTGLLVFNIYTVYQSLETYEMALFLVLTTRESEQSIAQRHHVSPSVLYGRRKRFYERWYKERNLYSLYEAES